MINTESETFIWIPISALMLRRWKYANLTTLCAVGHKLSLPFMLMTVAKWMSAMQAAVKCGALQKCGVQLGWIGMDR